MVRIIKKGNEIVKPKSEKAKRKNATDTVRMLRFMIAKFLHEKHGEEAFKDYIRAEIEMTERIKLGGLKGTLVNTLSKVARPFLMKEFVKNIIDDFQYEIPPEKYVIEEFNNKIKLEILKCPARIQFNKWARKLAPGLKNKICDWDILARDKVRGYGIDQKIELTEKGCILYFEII